MADLTCPDKLENVINDYNEFIYGADTADVTLSDGFVMPSYQKFAKDSLGRTGNLWVSTTDYLNGDIITKNNRLFIAEISSKGQDPETVIAPGAISYWKEVKKEDLSPVEGKGISGFVTFIPASLAIIGSRNVDSVTISTTSGGFEIKLNSSIQKAGKILFTYGYDSTHLDPKEILYNEYFSGYVHKYFLWGRTISASVDKIVIEFDTQLISKDFENVWNSPVHIIIY